MARDRLLLAPDVGELSGGPGPDTKGAAGQTTPTASTPPAGQVPQDKAGTEAKPTATEVPDDASALKALLAKEREDKAHLLKVHQEMKDKSERRAAEEEKARQENLRKQGEFEKLLNEVTPQFEGLKAKAKRQDEVLAAYLEAELAGVPDQLKALMPDGDTVAKLDWNQKQLLKRVNSDSFTA